MIKAIIFDFDGVLIESAQIKTEAFSQLFSHYPSKVCEIVKYHKINMGVSRYVKFRYFYENILGKELSDSEEIQLGNRFSQIVLDKVLEAPFVSGTLNFLERYYQNIPLFIASGTPDDELKYILKKRGISKYFKGIYGSPREKSEIIMDILSGYSLNIDDVFFVGDAESDLKAAKETGVCFVARIISRDSNLEDCSLKINDLGDLKNLLENLND